MTMFGRKKEEEKETAYDIPVIADDAGWNACFIAAESMLAHGNLSKAADFWSDGVDRWDGEDRAFVRAYGEIPRKAAAACIAAVEPGTVYPVPAMARVETEMEIKHPGIEAGSVTGEMFRIIASEVPRAQDPQDVVVLYMNCCYLDMGYRGWAADIRDVPIKCRDCIDLGATAAETISAMNPSKKRFKMDKKMSNRSVLLFRQFFNSLNDAATLSIDGKSLPEIEKAVMYWECNRTDRAGYLADGLDDMSRYAMSTKLTAKKHLASCHGHIADFVDGYFDMEPPAPREPKAQRVKNAG